RGPNPLRPYLLRRLPSDARSGRELRPSALRPAGRSPARADCPGCRSDPGDPARSRGASAGPGRAGASGAHAGPGADAGVLRRNRMATVTDTYLRDELLERHERLEAAIEAGGESARLAGLLEEVDAALKRLDQG